MSLIALPIDPVLPGIVTALRETGSVVLEAPPGAGKTTRVPPAILQAGLAGDGMILVLQPRRLAARLAAARVAEEMGEQPGQTVGWQVRFEDVSSKATRIKFVTEGILARRLVSDPSLKGVSAVLLDEFHERHLEGDIALALLRRLKASRPELKLMVMSATLDAAPIAEWMGARRITSEGRRFEVALEYLEREDDRPLALQVGGALKRLLLEKLEGDVLVFLPGAAEIRRAQEACAEVAARNGLVLLPLHGDLPPAEQDRAVKPDPGGRRKVILSTNVAETSVTIDGIVAVIDSGLARIASLAAWSGIPRLLVSKVSRASATQRAGRAGRTRPGRALRLYTRHDHDTRPANEIPEIRRLDLADPVLSLRAAGVDARELQWFEAPPEGALEAAELLLSRLGAVREGKVTPVGRQMLRFAVHPRQSRLILEAEARGAGAAGCLVAALLGERDIRSRAAPKVVESGRSDLLALRDAFEEARRFGLDAERLRSRGFDPGAVFAVERVRKQLENTLQSLRRETPAPPAIADDEEPLLLATLAGHPDRVARRRREVDDRPGGGGDELALAGGGAARLAPESVMRDEALMVAVDVEERREAASRGPVRGGPVRGPTTLVRVASAIEPEWLLDLFPERLREEIVTTWNAAAERVDAVSRLVYDELILEESKASAAGEPVAAALRERALAAGLSAFAEDLDRLLERLAFVRQSNPDAGFPEITAAQAREVLGELCEGRRSFAELREASLTAALLGRLDPKQARALDTLAPERLTLPGGRGLRIEYEAGKPPWIASRLQDFFGMAKGPSVAGGRVPVVLHLLAPNQRDLQVTTDLAGFWDRHYPAIRKELMRKYPRHAWPEDPRTATPPVPKGRR